MVYIKVHFLTFDYLIPEASGSTPQPLDFATLSKIHSTKQCWEKMADNDLIGPWCVRSQSHDVIVSNDGTGQWAGVAVRDVSTQRAYEAVWTSLVSGPPPPNLPCVDPPRPPTRAGSAELQRRDLLHGTVRQRPLQRLWGAGVPRQLQVNKSLKLSLYFYFHSVYLSGTVHANTQYCKYIPELARRLVVICSPRPGVKFCGLFVVCDINMWGWGSNQEYLFTIIYCIHSIFVYVLAVFKRTVTILLYTTLVKSHKKKIKENKKRCAFKSPLTQ